MLQVRHSLSSALEHLKSFQQYDELRTFVIYLLQHINTTLTRQNFNDRIAEIKPAVKKPWINPDLSAEFIKAAYFIGECLKPQEVEFLFPEPSDSVIAPQYKAKKKVVPLKLDSGSHSDPEYKLLAENSSEDRDLLMHDAKKSKKRYSNLL